jgi:hypothetical protein
MPTHVRYLIEQKKCSTTVHVHCLRTYVRSTSTNFLIEQKKCSTTVHVHAYARTLYFRLEVDPNVLLQFV